MKLDNKRIIIVIIALFISAVCKCNNAMAINVENVDKNGNLIKFTNPKVASNTINHVEVNIKNPLLAELSTKVIDNCFRNTRTAYNKKLHFGYDLKYNGQSVVIESNLDYDSMVECIMSSGNLNRVTISSHSSRSGQLPPQYFYKAPDPSAQEAPAPAPAPAPR